LSIADENAHLFEARIAALEARVAALEQPPATPIPTPAPDGTNSEALLDYLRQYQAPNATESEARGAIQYTGALELPSGAEYSWQIMRPVAGLLALDVEPLAQVLAALGSPQRLLLVRAMLDGPRSSHQLQEALGIASAGQLYHHLKELLATGIIEQRGRSVYRLAARNVVPYLVALALAYDLRSGQRAEEGDA
jgi:DNA-binding transcriptional ArsR family regulator